MVFINWLKPVVQKNHRISTEWIVLEIAEVPEWSMTWKERVLRIPLIEPGSKKKTSEIPPNFQKNTEKRGKRGKTINAKTWVMKKLMKSQVL